jgi:hypothetical protein
MELRPIDPAMLREIYREDPSPSRSAAPPSGSQRPDPPLVALAVGCFALAAILFAVCI